MLHFCSSFAYRHEKERIFKGELQRDGKAVEITIANLFEEENNPSVEREAKQSMCW